MNSLATWMHSAFAQSLAWTLLHFLWEGAALGLALAGGLWLFHPASSRRRYALACTVLAAMPLAFGATLAVMWARQPAPLAASIGWAPSTGQPVPMLTMTTVVT